MNTFLKKHELLISIALIIIYVVCNSYCMQNFGSVHYMTAIINGSLCGLIILFVIYNKLGRYYGFTVVPNFKRYIYFIPLVLLISVNFWGGINISNTPSEIIFYVITMLFVGFLEEIIFRGMLYKVMAKDNEKSAIIISSLTFGIGHIVNLLNGAEVILTLIQICYSVAVGFLFVIIFKTGKSLWPCIISHGLINALAIFSVENIVTLYIAPIVIILICVSYVWYIIGREKV